MKNGDQFGGHREQRVGKTKKTVATDVRDSAPQRKGRMEEVAGKVRTMYGDAKRDEDKG